MRLRNGRALIGAAGFAAAALCMGSVCYAQEKPLLIVPVTIEPPLVQDVPESKDDNPLYEQVLRPTGGIVTKSDFPVHLENPRTSLLEGPPKGPFDFVVPAGTPFVKALWRGREIYCTLYNVKEGTFGGYYDAGICLGDADADGNMHSLYLAAEWPFRIRSVIDIQRLSDDAPKPINVASGKLSTADTPAFELRALQVQSKGLFVTAPIILLELCPKGAVVRRDVCNQMDWVVNAPGARASRRGIAYLPAIKPGDRDKISWGPIELSYEVLPGKSLQTRSESILPQQLAYLINIGHTWFGSNQKDGVSIIHLVNGHSISFTSSNSQSERAGVSQ
jgi:hypothetical protein